MFLDKELQEKALADFNSLQQGSRSFGELLNVLRRLIMEAGGDGWSDRVKKGFLDAALSGKMKDNMIQLQKSENFETYCQQLQQIADRLQERQSEKATGGNRRGLLPALQPVPRSPGDVKGDPDAMDWEPTLAALKQRHVKWVDEEERAKRRREGRCLKCGSPAVTGARSYELSKLMFTQELWHLTKTTTMGKERKEETKQWREQNL